MVFAHRRDDGKLEQLGEHLYSVASRCASFADYFGAREWGAYIGRFHDLGKNTAGFQHRLLEDGEKVDHSTAGAQAVCENTGDSLIPAYCIACHHSGLLNGGTKADVAGSSTLSGRMKKECLPLLSSDYSPKPGDQPIHNPSISPLCTSFVSPAFAMVVRMLFSCLVDADFLSTEEFMQPDCNRRSMDDYDFSICSRKLEACYRSFSQGKDELNRLRTGIAEQCRKQGEKGEGGIYSLYVPTGTGKTLASMNFALAHLQATKKRRIIYVIPFTSIIEQNAQVFRNLFGEDVVLEHHCNVDYQTDGDEVSFLQLASENWDMPIVVTTNVQFFDSLFTNKVSKSRKLHNIVDSVIIFDEVQMLPTTYLVPCMYAVAELVKNYSCSVLFCSATQPPFSHFLQKFSIPITQVIGDSTRIFQTLRRVTYNDEGQLTDVQLVSRFVSETQVLCIVNSKKHAKHLFELARKNYPNSKCFYLTTNMCAVHRSMRLDEIRKCLSAGVSCIVISTSLIEAGVDIDFPRVFRELTGVDSIVQSAGRCNREGKRASGKSIVSIFEADEKESGSIPRQIRQQAAITKMILANYGCDFNNPELVSQYYTRLYAARGEENFDAKGIMKLLSSSPSAMPFEKIAEAFSLIDDNGTPVFIPFDATARLIIEDIRSGWYARSELRKLQRYSVNVHHWQLEELQKEHAVMLLGDNLCILEDPSRYSQDTGLEIGNQGNAFFDC
ncbi:MAG: CRISPR-associated helicase Cas3' [Spirochaetia bacterium]|jgi:CRISPR-associated endonuclease/helicase Cas3|nr:CRISPR-associated helicase Cas3' [Spirochaetia bacterium]